MTGTLLKHEIIRTRGLLLSILGGAAAVSAVGALTAATGWPVLAQFGFVLGLIGVVGLVPALQLGLAIDYWRSGYGRVGYFTQTLPVRGSTVYGVRLLWATIVLAVGLLATAALIVLVWFGIAGLVGYAPLDIFRLVGDAVATAFEASPWLTALGAPLLLLLLYGMTTVMLYCAASVGSEQWLQRLGWGGPVLLWFVLYSAVQIVMFVLVIAIPLGIGVDGDGRLGIVQADLLGALVQDVDVELMPLGFVPAVLLVIPLMVWRTARSWDRRVSLA